MIIEKAVNLSLIEVFLGSFLHLLHIPFGGHFLSLNQGLFLTRNSYEKPNRPFAPWELTADLKDGSV